MRMNQKHRKNKRRLAALERWKKATASVYAKEQIGILEKRVEKETAK